MAKTKVKRLNHREEKKNPFNFRFNKVKHKVVNQQRANESDPIGRRSQIRPDKIPAKKLIKKKDNAEYMSEMFEKKRKAQAERDKTETLRCKVDDQFNDLKSSFLSKAFARNEPNDSKQIDSYDLIFNDLLVNGDQRQDLKLPTLTSSSNRASNSASNPASNQRTDLRTDLMNVDCDTNLPDAIELLDQASAVPELKDAVLFKLVELLRFSKMSNLKEICNLMVYCEFLLQITSKAYFPELIKTVQNVLILFSKSHDHDKLFLPIYKLQKLKENRDFLHFDDQTSDRRKSITFDSKTISTIDFEKNESQLKLSLLDETLKLIIELKARYKQLEAFEFIFYYVDKLIDQLISDYPSLQIELSQAGRSDSECKPKLQPLVMPRQKPSILPMLEPDYSLTELKRTTQEIEQGMRKKLKRVSKSVQRDVKKESALASSVKLQETMEKDRVRKEKVKRLISEIQAERSMFKK